MTENADRTWTVRWFFRPWLNGAPADYRPGEPGPAPRRYGGSAPDEVRRSVGGGKRLKPVPAEPGPDLKALARIRGAEPHWHGHLRHEHRYQWHAVWEEQPKVLRL